MSSDITKIRVVILFGGESAEHDVSCVTAAHVLRALDPTRYETSAVGITRQGEWLSANANPDPNVKQLFAQGPSTSIAEQLSVKGTDRQLVVIPLLHGPMGEDGTVQGALELLHVPYVGAGVLGSAISMDKGIAKQILAANQIAQGEYITVHESENRDEVVRRAVEELGLPVFVKPANMGSSIGVSKAKTSDEVAIALTKAFSYDEWVLVEEAIVGREIEVAVLGNENPTASVPGEIVPSREFYDYEDKYLVDGAKLLIPAPLSIGETREVQDLATRVFFALRANGMARVDFFYEKGGRGFLCNEINTIPGFTPISMYPKLWQASGVSYPQLLDRLIDLAIAKNAKKRHNTTR